jgi:hypothetical protein
MALVFERTRRQGEKVDRLEVRRVSRGMTGPGELVSRIPLRMPPRIPRRVREKLGPELTQKASERA